MMSLETVIEYLQDEIKRSAPFSGHKDAMKIALQLVRAEMYRRRRAARRVAR